MPYSLNRLIIFFALTFAWSWACWLLIPFVKPELNLAVNLLFFVGGFGPTLIALLMVTRTDGLDGLGFWLTRCLPWRGNWRLIAVAFLAPLAVLSLATAADAALGGDLRFTPSAGYLATFTAHFLLVFLLGGPLGEELGWRGYALPAMLERLGWRSSSLALGAIWGVWHLPLFFITDSSQNQGSLLSFFVLIVATSVIYTRFFIASKASVLPAMMLHTASNAWPSLIPILPSDENQRPYLFVVGLVVMASVWLLAMPDRHAATHGSPS